MNKHILLVMKWLNDNDSVTQKELDDNSDSAADADAAAYAAAAAADDAADYVYAYAAAAADAADAAAYAAAAADAAAAEKWVRKYFERTKENKQDYIDMLKSDIKPLTPPIKLVDGKAYQFDVRDKGGIFCGIYHEYDNKLHVGQAHYFDLLSATNIQLLEVKK